MSTFYIIAALFALSIIANVVIVFVVVKVQFRIKMLEHSQNVEEFVNAESVVHNNDEEIVDIDSIPEKQEIPLFRDI